MGVYAIPFALTYDDVLLTPNYSQITSRSLVDLSTHLTPHITLKIPLLSANMDTVTGVEMAKAIGKLGGLGILPRFNTIGEQAAMVKQVKNEHILVGAAVGIKEGFLQRIEALVHSQVDVLVLDVAHGHQSQVVEAIKTIKNRYPQIDLVAGNVATAVATRDLFLAGADCVKVGVGPGTACITRVQTGFGIPQITAVLEAAKIAKKMKKTLICDGGTKSSGDIVKGLAAGSHAVMVGSQLAGTEEAPGETVIHEGNKFKRYNGSASIEEKRKHFKKMVDDKMDNSYLDFVEGISSLVPYRGSVEIAVNKLLAGIRSGFSYAGANNLAQLHNKARFVQISHQGVR